MEIRINHVNTTTVGQATDEDRLEVEASGEPGDVATALEALGAIVERRLWPLGGPEEIGLDGPPDPYTGSRLPTDPPSGPRLVITKDEIRLYGQGPGPEDGGLSMARNPETISRLSTVLKGAGKPVINVILPWGGPRLLASLEPSGFSEVDWDVVCTWAEDPINWALEIIREHLEPGQKVQVGSSTPRVPGSVGGSNLLVLGGPGDVARVFRYVPTALVEWLPPDLPTEPGSGHPSTEGQGDGGPATVIGYFGPERARKETPGESWPNGVQ
jgi:hypothetical protein